MNKRDQQRVMRYDEDIVEAEALLAEQREIESVSDNKLLLVSRAYERKLERMRAARARFIRSCGHAANQQERYNLITAEKRAAVARAVYDYSQELARYSVLCAGVSMLADVQRDEDMKIQHQLVMRKKRIISARQGALDRWMQINPHDISAPMPARENEDEILAPREIKVKQSNDRALMAIKNMPADMQEIARASRATSNSISVKQDTYSASFALLNSQPTPDAFAFTRSDIEHTVDAMTLANIAVDVEVEPERDAEYIKFMQGLAVESEDVK